MTLNKVHKKFNVATFNLVYSPIYYVDFDVLYTYKFTM